jgi:hypothetical protein
MSITDKLSSAIPSKAGKGCAMCLVLEQLSDKDRSSIISAMRVPANHLERITDRQIAEILQSEGYEVSLNSVYRHRNNHLDKP